MVTSKRRVEAGGESGGKGYYGKGDEGEGEDN